MRFWLLLSFIAMVVAIREKVTAVKSRPVTAMVKSGSELSSCGTARRGAAMKTSKPTFFSLPAVKRIWPWEQTEGIYSTSRYFLKTIQDVSDCSIKFQHRNKHHDSPESAILIAGYFWVGLSPLKIAIRLERFCEFEKASAKELTSACHETSATEGDKGAATAAAAISKMLNSFCENPSLKVVVDRDRKCDGSIKKATITCLPRSSFVSEFLDGSIKYPSDLIIMMMKESVTNTVICNIITCILSEMKKGSCPANQQKTILSPLNSLVGGGICQTETTITTVIPANPQVYQDVSECSTMFQKLTRNSAFSPEKVMLSLDTETGMILPNVFCYQQEKSSAELTTACHATTATEGDKGTAFAATAISTMIHFFCYKSRVKVMVDRDGRCDKSVKKVTIDCLAKTTIKGGAFDYPSDLLIMMLKEYNSAAVCNIKTCIRSEMHKGSCSMDQQRTLLEPLDYLVSVCPSTETATPIPTTSKPPTTTTKKPTRPTDYSVRPFTDKSGEETRPDTGCVEWRNVGMRSLGSDCDDVADFMCSQRIPSTDSANCWAVKDEASCCKKVKVIKGRYYLSECLSDCAKDPTVCRKQHPATKAAKCSVRPSSTYGTTCCVAEFIYT